MKKALLVVDMQNICVGEKHSDYFKYNNHSLIEKVNNAIESNQDSIVIYIKNVMKRNLLNKFAPFQAYEGTEEVELVKNLNIVSDNVFTKCRGNAFSNGEFVSFLKEQEVECVEVVGVDGGGCVALTALGAVKEGYKVIVNETAIGTMFHKNKTKYFRKLEESGAVFIK